LIPEFKFPNRITKDDKPKFEKKGSNISLRCGITEASLKAANIIPLPPFEFNLDPEYWMRRFLFPYALDNSPLKLEDYPLAANVKLSDQDLAKKTSRWMNK
tara:strand:- start:1909 stop:2211 length:303 start_codon:yes stop_codon:yes gene_type:complete